MRRKSGRREEPKGLRRVFSGKGRDFEVIDSQAAAAKARASRSAETAVKAAAAADRFGAHPSETMEDRSSL